MRKYRQHLNKNESIDYYDNGVLPFHFSPKTITGRLAHVFADKGGWMAGIIEDMNGESIRVSGRINHAVCDSFGNIYDNVFLTATGVLGDKGYGIELIIPKKSYLQVKVWDEDAVIKYFSGPAFKGFGEKMAQRIWNIFDEWAFVIAKEDIDYMCRRLKCSAKEREILEHGLSIDTAEKVWQQEFIHMPKRVALRILKFLHNPDGKKEMTENDYFQTNANEFREYVLSSGYALCGLFGLSFDSLDESLRLDVGIPLDDYQRMRYLLLYHLERLLSETNQTVLVWNSVQFTYKDQPMTGAWRYLFAICDHAAKYPIPDGFANDFTKFEQMVFQHRDITSTQRKSIDGQNLIHVMPLKDWEDVHYVSKALMNCLETNEDIVSSFYALKKEVSHFLLNLKSQVSLNHEQEHALMHTLLHRMSVWTGGPGRGKTFLVKALIHGWYEVFGHLGYEDVNVIVLAPTGRAVFRLQESLSEFQNKVSCGTIARFIMRNRKDVSNDGKQRESVSFGTNLLDAGTGSFELTKHTLVIVDEMSMVDMHTFARLCELVSRSNMCIIGDIHQLPSIERGYVLQEIIRSKVIPVCELVQNMRANSPELVNNADKIRNGQLLDFKKDLMGAFSFLPMAESDTDEQVYHTCCSYYLDALANGYDYKDIMLLAPYRISVNRLNHDLQMVLTPKQTTEVPSIDGSYTYYCKKGYEIPWTNWNGSSSKDGRVYVHVMDRIMCTKNQLDVKWSKELSSGKKEVGYGVWNGDMGKVVRYYPATASQSDIVVIVLDDGRTVEITKEDAAMWALAYAQTVHKSQGSEASRVIMCVPWKAVYDTIGFLNRNLIYTAVTRAKSQVDVIGFKKGFDSAVLRGLVPVRADLSYHLVMKMHQLQKIDDVKAMTYLKSLGYSL